VRPRRHGPALLGGPSTSPLDPEMRLTSLVAACLLLTGGSSVTLGAEATEGSCSVVATSDSGAPVVVPLPSLHVIEATARDKPFVLPPDSPKHVTAIMCSRSSLVPARGDDKVLVAGYPLAIVSESSSGRRVLWLELSDGQFQVSYDKGALTAEEASAAQSRMNEFQTRLDAKPGSGSNNRWRGP
jgi:hypothetical protein